MIDLVFKHVLFSRGLVIGASKGADANNDDDDNGDFLIISAAKANVVQRVHKPMWKCETLLDKTSWTGHLENMQYFATLNVKTTSTGSSSNQGKTPTATKLLSDVDDYWLSDELIDDEMVASAAAAVSASTTSENENCGEASGARKRSNGTLTNAKTRNANNNDDQLGMLLSLNRQSGSIRAHRVNDADASRQRLDLADVEATKKAMQSNNSGSSSSKPNRRGLVLNRIARRHSKASAGTNAPPAAAHTNDPKTSGRTDRFLQLIVSKCRCEFYIVTYDDKFEAATSDDNATSNSNSNNEQRG